MFCALLLLLLQFLGSLPGCLCFQRCLGGLCLRIWFGPAIERSQGWAVGIEHHICLRFGPCECFYESWRA